MTKLTPGDSADILRGTTLDIYYFLLKTGKPYGIREIQRELKLSSPSVAQYHLSKLEEAGFLKKESGNFVINRVLLNNFVKINRFLIPRYLFYTIFSVTVFLIGIFFLRPTIISREYLFLITTVFIFTIIFFYETINVWRRGDL